MKQRMTVKEFARRRRCTTKYVYDLLAAGRLRGARKTGKVWSIPRTCLGKRRARKEEAH